MSINTPMPTTGPNRVPSIANTTDFTIITQPRNRHHIFDWPAAADTNEKPPQTLVSTHILSQRRSFRT